MFLSADGDDIGHQLEGLILEERGEQIYDFSKRIQEAISSISEFLQQYGKVIMFGADNILIELKKGDPFKIAKTIQEKFFRLTNCTITIGLGDSILSCYLALRKGKCSGKNQIIIWDE